MSRYSRSPLTSLHVLFFTDSAPTQIYTLSLHDALPICTAQFGAGGLGLPEHSACGPTTWAPRSHVSFGRPPDRAGADRKSTRLNSSHRTISYAVFCLKKKSSGHLQEQRGHSVGRFGAGE